MKIEGSSLALACASVVLSTLTSTEAFQTAGVFSTRHGVVKGDNHRITFTTGQKMAVSDEVEGLLAKAAQLRKEAEEAAKVRTAMTCSRFLRRAVYL
jgi:hypothetical protein